MGLICLRLRATRTITSPLQCIIVAGTPSGEAGTAMGTTAVHVAGTAAAAAAVHAAETVAAAGAVVVAGTEPNI